MTSVISYSLVARGDKNALCIMQAQPNGTVAMFSDLGFLMMNSHHLNIQMFVAGQGCFACQAPKMGKDTDRDRSRFIDTYLRSHWLLMIMLGFETRLPELSSK